MRCFSFYFILFLFCSFLNGEATPFQRYQGIPQVSFRSFTDADRLDCLLPTAIANLNKKCFRLWHKRASLYAIFSTMFFDWRVKLRSILKLFQLSDHVRILNIYFDQTASWNSLKLHFYDNFLSLIIFGYTIFAQFVY